MPEADDNKGKKRLLLHICCAPDATVPIRALHNEEWDVIGFFYGSNIHPEEEYSRRLEALHLLQKHELFPVEESAYNPDEWYKRTAGLHDEPEGGGRCAVCFRLQLRAAAKCALENGCTHLCTTLTISPHKNVALISRTGQDVSSEFALIWEDRIWRKNNGFLKSLEITRELGLYRQNYCGCRVQYKYRYD